MTFRVSQSGFTGRRLKPLSVLPGDLKYIWELYLGIMYRSYIWELLIGIIHKNYIWELDIWIYNSITMQPLCYAGLRRRSWPQCPNPPICSCPPWQLGDGNDHVHDDDRHRHEEDILTYL